MISVVIDGHPYRLNDEDPKVLVGRGGEADVFRFNPHPNFTARHGNMAYAVKIFREDTEAQRQAARERQTKLRNFPKNLPKQVVSPIALVFDRVDKVIGYVMELVPDARPLIEYKTRAFRKRHRVTARQITGILRNLYDLVVAIHRAGVVIGDFNDKNILIGPGLEVYLIDADSLQYGRWDCPTFVPGFIDPLICEKATKSDEKSFNRLIKNAPHSQITDWYAFTVIAFQLFIQVHPYTGGFHTAGKGVKRIHHRASWTTAKLPAGASTPPVILPLTLNQYFRAVFDQDHRSIFPRSLLEESLWMICPQCRTEHGRNKCPSCGTMGVTRTTPPQSAPPKPSPPQQSNRLFLAVASNGEFVHHEDGAYCRGNTTLWKRAFDIRISALIAGSRTVLAAGPSFVIFDGNKPAKRVESQQVYGKTTVAANRRYLYWVDGNHLVRDDGHGNIVTIEAVAPHMTSVWVGDSFGVAMVQAGILTRIQTFDTERSGFLRSFDLPPELDTVIDAKCVINDDLAWLVVSSKERGSIVNRCYVFNRDARLQATAVGRRGDGTWLGCFDTALPVGHALYTPIPRVGIAKLGIRGGKIEHVGTLSGTEALTRKTTVGLCLTLNGLLHVGVSSVTRINL